MDRKTLAARIAGILDGISRLNNNVCAMGSLDIQRCPENYEALSTQAALTAEKIACQLRSLLYATTRVPKEEYLVQASKTHGIEIEQKDGVLQITLPCLLPKRRSRQSGLFLGDPLYAALGEYTASHKMPRFRECTVCFCHVYSDGLPPWRLPDHDNLQQKQILDTVALYTMTDDGSPFCDIYHTSQRGGQSCTRVFVMAEDRFPI